ncbi:hypothetical protein [Streptomyces sp. NPDC003077]|uniref:hypothetical protein n=1 Tax=Streptomyces sp. NPDC003077 TaxID=3154443 RepID=UPI0033B6356F
MSAERKGGGEVAWDVADAWEAGGVVSSSDMAATGEAGGVVGPSDAAVTGEADGVVGPRPVGSGTRERGEGPGGVDPSDAADAGEADGLADPSEAAVAEIAEQPDAPPGFARARAVADAVLFEGYVLYPYRASAPKNRLRWQFGVLAPQGADPSETTSAQTDCLVEPGRAGPDALTVRVRFLQVRRRAARGPGDLPWDEGVVREVDARAALVPGTVVIRPFTVPGGQEDGRRWWPLTGTVRIAVEAVPGPYGLLRVRVRTENETENGARHGTAVRTEHGTEQGAAVRTEHRTAGGEHGTAGGECGERAEMLRGAFVGTHALLAVDHGHFLSPTDPPEWAAGAAAGCVNRHAWPALIDDRTVLSAPIILGDHPRIAPESPADLYDGTEIDELLTLRTMTLTDAEKREARATDPRAAAIIEHADGIGPEVLARLHGVVRPSVLPQGGLPQARPPRARPPYDDRPDGDADAPATVPVPGGTAAAGVRVRLLPGGGRRADAQDMFLAGRTARVAAVLRDVDGGTHLAVTLDDDPGADLHHAVGRYRYFAPDEVELL